MSLLVGQLIYTNLPKTGFKLLVSQHISLEVQNRFVDEIVHPMWDAYNPPPQNYQAVFLQQFSLQSTLFGWLYNNGQDDLGRAHIPYFLGYYLTGKLDKGRLQQILGFLAAGPIDFLDREDLSEPLGTLILPEAEDYSSPRPGLVIPSHLQEQLFSNHKDRQLLQLRFPHSQARLEPAEMNAVDYSEIPPVADREVNSLLASLSVKSSSIKQWLVTVIANKLKDFVKINKQDQSEEMDGPHPRKHPLHPLTKEIPHSRSSKGETRQYQTAIGTETRKNLIGMPGISNTVVDVVVIEPHSLEEMPQVIQNLLERKSVVLNLNVIDPGEAQKAIDFLGGGTYAIDGHQEHLGESIFLLTPKGVKARILTETGDNKVSALPSVNRVESVSLSKLFS